MFKSLLIISLTFGFSYLFGQIKLNEWREHFPYHKVYSMVEAGDLIFATCEISMYSIHKEDLTIQKYSEINGMSDIKCRCLAYDEELKTLVIGYENANMDLMIEGTFYNFPEILESQALAFKRINNIILRNHKAYISTNFGIVVFDMLRKEFSETYKIGPNGAEIFVNQVAFLKDSIYAATTEGIYSASLSSSNLQNFAYWKKIQKIDFPEANYESLVQIGENLIACYNSPFEHSDRLYKFESNTWSVMEDEGVNYKFLNISRNKFLVGSNLYQLKIFDQYLKLESNFTWFGSLDANLVLLDGNDVKWISEGSYGLFKKTLEGEYINVSPNSPFNHLVSDIDIVNNQVYMVQGGRDNVYTPLYQLGIVSNFKDNHWESQYFWGYQDFNKIAINPRKTNQAFVASIGQGVKEFLDSSLSKTFMPTNSSLQGIGSQKDIVRISDVKYDKDNNLWVSNIGVDHVFSVLTPDSQWIGIPIWNKIGKPSWVGSFMIDDADNKWTIKDKGIFIFNENNTLEKTTDDRVKVLDNLIAPDGSTISEKIYSLAQDQDGYIWLGTESGPVVCYSPQGVFDAPIYFEKCTTFVASDTAILLENEYITAIKVDGANRKWLGTKTSGAFLVSADGSQQILNFNTENSPLPSNFVADIEIDPKTGEVFFGTGDGLISYMGNAIEGYEVINEIQVFPNPVKPNYQGFITIKGLITKSNIKISDMAGNLVFETTSLGGQAVWDGKNFSGEKLSPGIYLIFCASADGKESKSAKILILN